MPDLIPLVRITRITHMDGTVEDVEVSADVKALIEATEPKLKERLFRDPDATELIADPRTKFGRDEGPRYDFTLFHGENLIWGGPEHVRDVETGACLGCGCGTTDLQENINAYCLVCDKCGRDYAVKRPTAIELGRLPVPTKDAWSEPDEAKAAKTPATPTKLVPSGLAGGRGCVCRKSRKVRRKKRA